MVMLVSVTDPSAAHSYSHMSVSLNSATTARAWLGKASERPGHHPEQRGVVGLVVERGEGAGEGALPRLPGVLERPVHPGGERHFGEAAAEVLFEHGGAGLRRRSPARRCRRRGRRRRPRPGTRPRRRPRCRGRRRSRRRWAGCRSRCRRGRRCSPRPRTRPPPRRPRSRRCRRWRRPERRVVVVVVTAAVVVVAAAVVLVVVEAAAVVVVKASPLPPQAASSKAKGQDGPDDEFAVQGVSLSGGASVGEGAR